MDPQRPVRTAEGDIQHDYYVQQFKTLLPRHSLTDVMLVRVLTDYYQLIANVAKAGRCAAAKYQLQALSHDIGQPAGDELGAASRIAELPVRALINWLEGEAAPAVDQLQAALECGHLLAGTYQHSYLTPRRIYIGVNMSRVLISQGEHTAAVRLIDALTAVAAGERLRWPFGGADSLTVPLTGMHRSVIGWHLNRARSVAAQAHRESQSVRAL